MQKTLLMTALLSAGLLLPCAAFSQEKESGDTKIEKKTEIGLDGMLAVSIGEKTIGINVGGPTLKLRIDKFRIGFGAMPSLFIRDDKAVPRLAVSPIVEYDRWMLIAPYYGYDGDGKQIWTFGLGYNFF